MASSRPWRALLTVAVLLALQLPLHVAAEPAVPSPAIAQLQVHSQIAPTRFSVPLSQADKNWIAAQGELRIGVWGSDLAPIQFRSSPHTLEGILADYLSLLGSALDVPVSARWYPDRDAALSALRAHEIVAVSVFAESGALPGLTVSGPYLSAPLAIIRRAGPALGEEGILQGRGVAVAAQTDAVAFLRRHPQAAPVSLASSAFKALESVSVGRADYYAGDLVSASYAIEQGWFLNLRLARVESVPTCFQLVTAANEPQARRVMDLGLGAIHSWMRNSILRSWAAGAAQDMDAVGKLALTDAERDWITAHPVVRVAVDTTNAPYTFIDSAGEFAGVYADLLKMIGRRTGIRFEVRPHDTIAGLDADMRNGRADMVATLMPTPQRERLMAFTTDVAPTVWVLVTDPAATDIDSLQHLHGRRLAIVRGHGMVDWIRARHPDIRLMEVDTSIDAMDLVARGGADASLQSMAAASYSIERYFDQLRIVGAAFDSPEMTRFGVARKAPELLGILDRALEGMSSAERASIASRWLANINYPTSTWQSLRRSVFAWLPWAVAGLAFVVAWNSLLQYQIRRRRQAERQWRAAKDAAERANVEKSNFLAEMSHEIRTPMSAVIGLLEMANRRAEGGTVDTESLILAEASAKGLLDLLGNLLDLRKIEAGELQITPRPMALRALINEVVTLFSHAAGSKGVQLTLAVAADVPDWIQADPLRLRQVLANVLSNAVKFTTRGEIVLDASCVDGNLCISVRDSGVGIAAETLEGMFQPFRQASTEDAPHGTGLGLSIVRRLVTLMGGEVALLSRVGEGTDVRIRFPCQPAHHVDPQQDGVLFAQRPLRVLVVDDHPLNLRVLEDQLQWLGYEVVQACSGEAALATLRALPIDLVLTDCGMPGMSGMALVRAIRAEEGRSGAPHRPLIGYTANALPEARQAGLSAGMDDLLVKPLSVAQLGAVLGSWTADIAQRSPQADAATPPPRAPDGLGEELGADLDVLGEALAGQRWDAVADQAHRIRGAVACIAPDADIDQATLVLELQARRAGPHSPAALEVQRKRLESLLLRWIASQGAAR